LESFRAAGLALLLGGAMDALDGAVARATGRSTPFGGFYDSVSDRISDALIFGGIVWAVRDEPRLLLLALVGLVAASITSYVRARAEAIDLECSVGILERAERAIALILALLLHQWLFEPVLWFLAIEPVPAAGGDLGALAEPGIDLPPGPAGAPTRPVVGLSDALDPLFGQTPHLRQAVAFAQRNGVDLSCYPRSQYLSVAPFVEAQRVPAANPLSFRAAGFGGLVGFKPINGQDVSMRVAPPVSMDRRDQPSIAVRP
jgi:hypothetical protein